MCTQWLDKDFLKILTGFWNSQYVQKKMQNHSRMAIYNILDQGSWLKDLHISNSKAGKLVQTFNVLAHLSHPTINRKN